MRANFFCFCSFTVLFFGCIGDKVDVDTACTMNIWYQDRDKDGFGDASVTDEACVAPLGYTNNDDDCDDTNTGIHPGAEEMCDFIDNNCDGEVDRDATSTGTWYADVDNDGYGNDETWEVWSCGSPGGITWATVSGDCDDNNAAVNPSATEVCDGADNDCDGEVDEYLGDFNTWYVDADGDGYGNDAVSTATCDEPTGHVANSSDCDDTNPFAYPGAEEICDGEDNDCDDIVDEGAGEECSDP